MRARLPGGTTTRSINPSYKLRSMPPVCRDIDALCHCLRPHLSRVTPVTLSYRTSKSLSFFSQGDIVPVCHAPGKKTLRKGFIRNTPRPTFSPSRFVRFRSIRRVETGPKDLPRQPKLHEFKDTQQGYVLPGLENSALYNELQHVALKGDFIRTHVLVETLVKERGEEPNINLYLALILANTSTQHGSPAEVKRLLDEMENEGLVPNSAIYHAVLKVARQQPIDAISLLTCAGRSLPYIHTM